MREWLPTLLVALFSAANGLWCALLWWRLRRLATSGGELSEAAARLDGAVAAASEVLDQLRGELVASERALERRTEMARRRAEELGRLCEAAQRLARGLRNPPTDAKAPASAPDNGPAMAERSARASPRQGAPTDEAVDLRAVLEGLA